MSSNYATPGANARAVVKLVSWLEATGIEHELSQVAGADLVVKATDGRRVPIRLALTPEEAAQVPAGGIVVSAKELAASKQDVALKAFHEVTEGTGHGNPIPVDRGAALERKASFVDNPELVALRHNEFRRVPNPDPQQLMQFKPVMTQACHYFWNRNKDLCRRHGIEVDDLMTYALAYTTIYLGLYRVLKETNNDNVKKLRAFLNQRFVEFFHTWTRKEKNILPSTDVVHLAMFGTPESDVDGLWHCRSNFGAPESEDSEWSTQHSQLDTSSDEARAKSARKLLDSSLASLPHDKLVQTLSDAAANTHICIAARNEAGRRLQEHRRHCVQCGGVPAPEPQKQDADTQGVPQGKPPTRRSSGGGMFPEARQAFEATLPATRVCPACQKEKPVKDFGIRLMNGPDASEGRCAPVFRLQARCSPCRRCS